MKYIKKDKVCVPYVYSPLEIGDIAIVAPEHQCNYEQNRCFVRGVVMRFDGEECLIRDKETQNEFWFYTAEMIPAQ